MERRTGKSMAHNEWEASIGSCLPLTSFLWKRNKFICYLNPYLESVYYLESGFTLSKSMIISILGPLSSCFLCCVHSVFLISLTRRDSLTDVEASHPCGSTMGVVHMANKDGFRSLHYTITFHLYMLFEASWFVGCPFLFFPLREEGREDHRQNSPELCSIRR